MVGAVDLVVMVPWEVLVDDQVPVLHPSHLLVALAYLDLCPPESVWPDDHECEREAENIRILNTQKL